MRPLPFPLQPGLRAGLLAGLVAGLACSLAGCPSTPEPGAGNGAATPAGNAAPSADANAPGPAGGSTGTVRIGVMPKKKGIPYFNACERGAREAAADLKDVELTYDGPTDAQSELQSALVDTWTVRKFDAIAIACNDPAQISGSLARAQEQEIAVVTYDADADPQGSKRQFFVNQARVEDIAKALVDEMAAQAGADAKVAVVSSSSTAPNQVAWLKAMEAYRAKKYPGMKVVATEYAGENQVRSEEKAGTLLKAYPDVKGIWGMTSVAFPGAASAVKKAGKAGQVAVVGLGTPNDMKPFVKGGVVKTVILWSPVDLGYLTVCVARAVAKGELKPGAKSLTAGRLGEKKIVGDQVLLGEPMRFTAETIDRYDF